MSKIKDLMELNIWMGSRSRHNYEAIMEEKRTVPKDRRSILRELAQIPSPKLINGSSGSQ